MSDERLSPEELRATTLKGLRATLVARPTVEIILLGSMVLLARLISPADFGRYAIAVLVSGLGVVALTSLDAALVQRPQIDREHLQAGFCLALAIGLGFSVLTLIAASLIIAPLFDERTAEFVRIATIGIFISAFNVIPAALVQRGLEIKRLSILDVSGSVAYAAVAIGLAAAGLHGYALILGGVAQALTITVVNWVWAPQPMPRWHRRAVRELLHFGLPQSVAALAWVGFANIDYAIVGARLGPRAAGFYSRAYTIGVNYKQKITQVMTSVGFPVLSRTQSSEEMRTLRRHMVRLLTLVVFPMLVLLAVTAPVLVPWVFGAKWEPAVLPTQILAVGGATTLAIDAAGAVLMAEGRSRALLGFGWAHFATYAGLVWIGASFGIVAVSVAASIDHAIFLVVAYVLMLRGTVKHALARLWEDVGPAVICSVVCAAVAIPLSAGLLAAGVPPVPYLVAVTLPAVGAYVLTLRLSFPEPWRVMSVFATHVLPQRGLPRFRRSRTPARVASPAVGRGESPAAGSPGAP